MLFRSLDDYFYPYPVNGLEFSDDETYKKYGEGFFTKEEWRRNNVDTFISELNNAIKSKDSTLKFGVSPFGIWRNGESVGGSATSGLSSYDDVYVDSRKWIKEGYIDYIIPQIYDLLARKSLAAQQVVSRHNLLKALHEGRSDGLGAIS